MTDGDSIRLNVMTDNKYETSGPYSIIDGVVSDAEIWRAEMDDETERLFDEYLLAKAISEAAEEELAKRAEVIKRGEEAFNELMAPFVTKPRK